MESADNAVSTRLRGRRRQQAGMIVDLGNGQCMIDRDIVDPVELDADFASVTNVVGNVVELVHGKGQLQPGNRQQPEPNGRWPLD